MPQFRNSVMWKDVDKILNSKYTYYPLGKWSLKINTKCGDIDVLKITNIDVVKDFVNNMTDNIIVSFHVDRGTYLAYIYPHLDNLEVTLYRYPIQDSKVPFKPDFKQKYKAIFLPNYNEKPLGTKDEMTSTLGLELMDPPLVHLQLMNLNVEPLRLKYVSGSLAGYTNEMALNTVIKDEVSKVTLPKGKVIDKVDIDKPDNNKPVQNLVIPSGTNLLDLPAHIHNQGMGIYNSGIGTFVSNTKDIKTGKIESHFYVYPPYKASPKRPELHLFALPDFEMGYLTHSFILKGNTIHALGHILDGYKSTEQANELSNGVGFRLANADSFMDKPVTMTKKGPKGASQKLNFKVATKSRPDGFNLANRTDEIASSNPYKYYSKFIKQTGSHVTFKWQQSDHTRIEPNMKVILHRLVGNSIVKEEGVLLHAATAIQMQGKGLLQQSGYTENTLLTVFITELSKGNGAKTC